ncbi:MAG: Gfo/Idh/MocA family oxidoreductase [Bacteroidota bacterium]|nr:Gfo/Idh/MocA family oxidoreductase [Bacteroidota bacterium]
MNRRDFIRTGSTAAAGGLLVRPGERERQRMKVALVGTGIRGSTMWGRSLVRDYANEVEFIGLCDINPGRLEYVKEYMGVDCPTYTDFDDMMRAAMMRGAKPDTVIVTTVDSTHHEYIIRALEYGCNVVTEKPMTTDAEKCQAILDAQARTRKAVTVTFNYRYSPHRQRMKELLMAGRIGTVRSVDFHWYLDVYHGASYFRRWHGKERYGGTLFVHKATHHFDLLNWWLESEPEEVFAYGELEYYGHNNPFRHTNCRGCPHADQCNHYWDITTDSRSMDLYVAHEHHDGYLRDGCVWSEEIDIYDKMSAQIQYANGVQVSYSCTTYSPYEGYRIAFNGTRGRMEAWVKERQPWRREPYDEIRVTDNFGETELIQVPHGGGGHGGGDRRLKDRIFKDPTMPDPYRQAAGARDGAMSILVGIAARESVKTGEPIRVASLTSLKPRTIRP